MHPGVRDLKDPGPTLFAVVAPGLEEVAAAEIAAHGFTDVSRAAGGVTFRGSPLRANRVLAIPTRILQRVAQFKAYTFEQLVAGAAAVDWTPFGGLTPRASCHKSRLYHSGAVAERLAQVVPPGEGELLCRIDRDRCTLSVDTSGERLHKRGWRTETGAAPLRETLAAGILALAGWRPGVPLYDPMCGSGTFLIEAAVQAAGLAPGRLRSFACERWERGQNDHISLFRGKAKCDRSDPSPISDPSPSIPIAGRDRARAAVEAARRNAARAGVAIEVVAGEAADASPPAPHGLLVCNPPYGRRAADAGAWDQLGRLLTGAFAGWDAAVLCPRPELAARLRRPVGAHHRLQNGGLRVELLLSTRWSAPSR